MAGSRGTFASGRLRSLAPLLLAAFAAAAELSVRPEDLPGAWAWLPLEATAGDADVAQLGASLLLVSSFHSTGGAKLNATAGQASSASAGRVQAGGQRRRLEPRSWFTLTFSFAFVVKAMCMMSNVMFQASPIPQVREFGKHKDTGEVDAAPFISILFCGCQWCFYGLFAFFVTKKSGFLVLVYSNVVGAFLGVYYVYGFQRNCRNKDTLRKLFLYYRFIATLAVLQVVAMATLQKQRALFFSGLVSSVCSVVGACSLLSTLPVILKTRCSSTINLPLLIVGMGSGVLWLCCGIILWDCWIMVPNMICMVVQLVALSLVMYFPRDPDFATQSPTIITRREGLPLTVRSFSAPGGGRGYGSLAVRGETGGTC